MLTADRIDRPPRVVAVSSSTVHAFLFLVLGSSCYATVYSHISVYPYLSPTRIFHGYIGGQVWRNGR